MRTWIATDANTNRLTGTIINVDLTHDYLASSIGRWVLSGRPVHRLDGPGSVTIGLAFPPKAMQVTTAA